MSATLRPARRADIPGVQRVRGAVRENRLVTRVITDAEVAAAIEPPGRGWVVEQDGQVVAFAIASGATGNVWALFVDPDHEGRGHGRALHEAMVDWLWSQGLDRLWLSTDAGTRAEGFYLRAGWQPVGRTASGEVAFEQRRPRPASTTFEESSR
jgi:GNAT superfamily N-acetyltransferase